MDTPSSIIPFSSPEFGLVRAYSVDGEPWFVATDVAKILGYGDATHLTRRLDDDEKGLRSVETPGGAQQVSVITEAGLYNAVLGSKVAGAKAFKRWVTHEVLPALRRDGAYVAADGTEDDATLMARALIAAKRQMDAKDARIAELSAENEAMRPKALLGEAVEPSRATYTVTEAARYVAQVVPSARRQDVFDLLRGAGMMCKGSTAPTREGIDTGRMVAVSHEFENGRGETVHRQTGRLTGKGLAWVVSRMTERAVA